MLVLAILVLLLISVAKVYRSIPLIELKRRARYGQEPAKSLFSVASYKYSSQIFLLFLASIASVFFFILVARKSPLWVAFTADLALIWLAYIWIPRSSINIVSQYFAQVLAKPLGWILQYIHPLFSSLNKKAAKPVHTGLYEKSDIVRLLSLQQKQTDNRIDEFSIDLLKHVLNFGHEQAIDLMTPKNKVHAVSSNETLGPIVLSELHKSKHSYFPVYEGKPSNIVGILSIVGLTNSRATVGVENVMSQSIYYVHEEQSLNDVLQVMIKTSQELFIVINSDKEYVGIITAREVLKTLVGETVSDEFDQYDNREQVANLFTKPPEQEEDLVIEEVEDTARVDEEKKS